MTHMTHDGKAIGERLRAIRKQRGLSLAQAAERSQGRWGAACIGAYERGDRGVTVARLIELAEFYGVPLAELLPDARDPKEWLAEVTANLEVHIESRAQQIAAPRIADAERRAAARIAEVEQGHDDEQSHWSAVITELRSRVQALEGHPEHAGEGGRG